MITHERLNQLKRQNILEAEHPGAHLEEYEILNLAHLGLILKEHHEMLLYGISLVKKLMQTDPEVRLRAEKAMDDFKKNLEEAR